MNPARLRAYLMILTASIIWAVATPVIKFTLQGFDPLFFLTYRFGISTVVALITFTIVGWHIPKEKNLFWGTMLYGFLTSTVSLGFLFFGMDNTTVLDSTLITLTVPLIISTAGVYFLHEHITKREKLGMGIAIIGTLLTVVEPLLQNGHSQIRLSGNLLVLGYVIATTIATVIGKKLLQKDVKALTLTNFSFIIGFLTLLPVLILRGGFQITNITEVGLPYQLGVFYMALLSGSLAYGLSNRAQKTVEIGEASLFSYLYPLFSLPLAIFWLGEKITPIFVIGAVIITIGVVIAEIKKKRYNSSS